MPFEVILFLSISPELLVIPTEQPYDSTEDKYFFENNKCLAEITIINI